MAPAPYGRPDNLAEIDRLARTLVKNPGSKAFMPLAEEYGKAGMWPEAAAVLEDGLKNYPGFVTAMVALGRVYDQLSQPMKAKAILEDAVKASPENLRAHRMLAKIYAAQGAIDAARQSCAVILSANSQDQEALTLQASLEAALSSVDSALTSLQHPSSGAEEDNGPVLSAANDGTNPSTVGMTALPDGSRQDDLPERRKVAQSPSATLIGRLEGWLASIRVRRRDGNGARDTDKPTS
jgi:tetratricopeptide (TPR) repeat protein